MYKNTIYKQSEREKELTELMNNDEVQNKVPYLNLNNQDGLSTISANTMWAPKTTRFQKQKQVELPKQQSKYLKQIIFCRHGATEEGQNNVLLGQKGGTLSRKGIEESIQVGQFLKHLNINIAYVSDLERTKQVFENINQQMEKEIKEVVYEPLIKDINLGKYTGTNLKDKNTYKIMTEMNKDRKIKAGKQGESWEDVEQRAMQFWNNMVEDVLYKTNIRQVLVVGHRGILTSLLENVYLSDIQIDEKVKFFNMPINYGEVLVVKTDVIDGKLTMVDFQRKQT